MMLSLHRFAVFSIGYLDSTHLISSSNDGIISWDFRKQRKQQLPGDNPDTPDILFAISSDRTLMATYNRSGNLRVSTSTTHEAVAEFSAGRMISGLAFSADQKRLISTSTQGILTFWDVSADSWMSRACLVANRDLSDEEQRRFLNGERYYPCPEY
jgi:WD40 repeat protein